MASDRNNSSSSKSRSAVPAIPGVEIIATASQRASRKMTAVQRTPFGQRVYEVIRNLMWVIPLTVLVWLYAEHEAIQPEQVITASVIVHSERTDRIVTPATSADRVLSINIKGTRIRMQQVRDELTKKQGLEIVAPAQLELGQVALPAVEAVNANPIFLQRGITVTSCTPSTLILQVDELVPAMEFRPEVPQEITSRLDGPAVFDPPAVTLSGPKRLLVGVEPPVEVIADITQQMLPKVGGEILAVPLRLKAASELIKITPPTVTARVKLRSAAVSYMINSVAVFTVGPPALFDKYRVNFPAGSFLSRVTVVGPQDEINKISSGEFIPKALLEVTQQDAIARLPRSPSQYILPEHVTVSDEDKNRTITFELVERTKAE